MKITEIKNNNHEILYTVKANKDEWKEIIEKVKVDLTKDLKMDGFRKGKVPANLIEKHLDKNHILDKASKRFLKKMRNFLNIEKETILKEKYRPLDYKFNKIDSDEIEVIQKYQKLPSIELEKTKDYKIEFKEIEISPKDVTTKIEELKINFSDWTISKEPSTKETKIKINLKATFEEKEIPELMKKEVEHTFHSKLFGEEFNTNLLGLKAGKKAKFEITLPKEFPLKRLANKIVSFDVEILEVKIPKPLKNEEELLSKLGAGKIKSIPELKKIIETNLLRQKIDDIKPQVLKLIWKELEKNSKIDISESYLSTETEAMKANYLFNLEQKKIKLEDHLKEIKKTKAEFETSLKENVKQILIDYLISSKVAILNDIDVSNEEMDSYYEFLSKKDKSTVEETKKKYNELALYNNYLRYKVEDFLIQNTIEFNKLIKDIKTDQESKKETTK